MEWTTWFALFIVLITIFSFAVISALPSRSSKKAAASESRKKIKTMIVLGSGGHTAEMISFLRTIDMDKYSPRCYIVASTDVGVNGSSAKAQSLEKEVGKGRIFNIISIPRSREVGQSYITSVWTTLKALFVAFGVVWKECPDLILTNGPGTCVPICISAYALRISRVKRVKIVFAESIACVDHISLSGKLLYYLVDRFFVQWKELVDKYPRAQYTGRLESETVSTESTKKSSKKGYVLVTVGSTLFDQLIKEVDRLEFVQALQGEGYSGLKIQYGRGKYVPQLPSLLKGKEFQVEIYDFKSTLKEEIAGAGLVISHAGAGSIQETLSSGVPLIVVPNESLMNNHQLQLAYKFSSLGFLRVAKLGTGEESSKLINVIAQPPSPRKFPTEETAAFRTYVEEEMN